MSNNESEPSSTEQEEFFKDIEISKAMDLLKANGWEIRLKCPEGFDEDE